MDALNRGEKIILNFLREQQGEMQDETEALSPKIEDGEVEEDIIPFQIWLDPKIFDESDSIPQLHNPWIKVEIDYEESEDSNIQERNIENIEDEGDQIEALNPVLEEGFLNDLLGEDELKEVTNELPKTLTEKSKLSGFREQETFIEKQCQFYLATSIRCLHDEYNSWNFTLQGDLMLDIYTNFSQSKSEIKLGRGLETRVVGSKIDAINALDDENWEKGGKQKSKKKKPKSRPLIEVDKKNILGGDGGLLQEEFDKEKWQHDKVSAQALLDARIADDRSGMVGGHFDVQARKISENIPSFDKRSEFLLSPDHIEVIPTSGVALSIDQLLDNYFMTRMLNNQDNNYECPECKISTDLKNNIRFITKYFRLLNPPQHFAIQLKRFIMIPNSLVASFQKDTTLVKYDLTLDMTKYFLSNKFGSFLIGQRKTHTKLWSIS